MSIILWCIFLSVKLALKESLAGEEFPLLSLTVVFASIRYGVGPALFVAALSVCAEYLFFLVPVHGTNEPLIIAASLLIYSLIVLTITYIIGRQKKYEKKLASLYEHQSQWVANVSHEVRTPLNGILGLLELLKKENLNLHQKSLLEHIEKSSVRLKSIVESILSFSKLSSARYDPQDEQPFSINELCQHIADIYKPRFFKKNIEFHFFDLGIPIVVKSNQTNISQILTNLLENALKYTVEGRVDFRILKKSENHHTIELEFLIQDTGIGLDKDEQGLIFEPYFRGNLDSKTEGVGLGLPIVKRLVEEKLGQIKVRSEKGAGSLFTVTLPFLKSEKYLDPQSNFSQNVAGLKNSPLSLRSQTALVAEDNPINQLVLKNQLESLGMNVTLVEDGLKAVEAYRQNSFDFIVLDAHMPIQNGLKTASLIRSLEKNEHRKSTPIICITADATYQKSMYPEIDLFLFKPVSSSEIQVALDQIHSQNTRQLIAGIFLKDTPQKIVKIRQALHTQNFIEIEAIAHNLKSSFYALGDADSAALCQEAYDCAKNADLAKLRCAISDLEQKYQKIKCSMENQG